MKNAFENLLPEEEKKYIKQAEYLIEHGYSNETDVDKLARMIYYSQTDNNQDG